MLPDYVDYSPIRYYIYYNDLMRAKIDTASIFLRGGVITTKNYNIMGLWEQYALLCRVNCISK